MARQGKAEEEESNRWPIIIHAPKKGQMYVLNGMQFIFVCMAVFCLLSWPNSWVVLSPGVGTPAIATCVTFTTSERKAGVCCL